ncbi:hemolysin family protein [Lentisphaera profundi]|uniref:Hemolysin family protein n=1 Tax=Lentisphaera profundi TaxID=1658616 RepID=A0ABY7VT87_9BACT|nr:hemolysin family protein [Lentisphaera profundi]WDE96087.1 hemolysin family protein [Lentisphaera profundi]
MEIFILLILLALASWTSSCRSSLRKLTGGLLRTLEDKTQTKCQFIDDNRPRFGFTLRAASFTFTTSYTLIAYNFFILEGAKNSRIEDIAYFSLIMLLYLLTREVIGSIWSRNYGIKILSNSLPAIKALSLLYLPYVAIVMYLHQLHEARLEESNNNTTKASAEDEILSLVEDDEDNDDIDSIEDEEARMIKGVFNLDDTTIREVMIPRPSITGVEKKQSLEEIKKLFISSGFSRLPVYDEKPDTIIGLVYAKDFLDYSRVGRSKLNDLLRPVEFVPETQTLDLTLPNFRKKKIHLAIVQDEFGGTAGLVTMEDILEEIVGEIQDEFDTEEESYIKIEDDGSATLDPRATIDNINEILNAEISDEEYDTIGAFIYNITGDIPSKGTELECDFFTAKILDADERNIISISLSLKTKEQRT